MIDPKFVQMLRCPASGNRLAIADDNLVEQVNQAIGSGQAIDRVDQTVEQPIDGGLCSGSWLYPIRDSIPSLIADDAISIADLVQGDSIQQG